MKEIGLQSLSGIPTRVRVFDESEENQGPSQVFRLVFLNEKGEAETSVRLSFRDEDTLDGTIGGITDEALLAIMYYRLCGIREKLATQQTFQVDRTVEYMEFVCNWFLFYRAMEIH